MGQEALKRKYRILKPPCGLHCIKMNEIGVRIGRETIIEHINLHIHCGRLTVIIGRNGAGKSIPGQLNFAICAIKVSRTLGLAMCPST